MSATDARSLVEIQDLTKTYGAFEAVKNLNLSVGRAQLFALLGPQWSGQNHHYPDAHGHFGSNFRLGENRRSGLF
jgi:ABC-type uncharacterized transport system ATPase subunit